MKPLRGLDETVLYLDFDGVLHHEDVWWHPRRGVYIKTPGYQLFEHVPLLEEVLASFPEVRIVLSTSWVRYQRFSGSVRRLSPSLRERVIGATFHSRMNRQGFESLPRGIQVMNDVARRKPRNWVALDDDLENWVPEYRNFLIHCDQVLGISAPGVLDALKQRLLLFRRA
ncbi:HAD domain-containing protein [Hydrogenophaga sp. SL48]|uniref:HAD domain-containing protein n=1 Tax=Hydrogenophaga sp. SL48 TaxID=2806347 RepID=UPI001F2DE812|nr:HAD domain-containing protein [Hydrogenophaga sp. SL48]